MEIMASVKKPVYERKLFLAAAAILLTGAGAYLGKIGPFMPMILFAVLTMAIMMLMKPNLGVCILLVILPLQGTVLMNTQFGGIPGMKLINLLPLLVIVAILLENEYEPYHMRDSVMMFAMFALFTLAMMRFMDHLEQNPVTIVFDEKYVPLKFLLSFWVKPVFFFLVMWMLSVRRRSMNQVSSLFLYLQWSMLVFSVCIIYIYFFLVVNKTDFELVREEIGALLGLHGNNIADFYIIGFPLILTYAFRKKNVFGFINIALAMAAVAVTYSRSAYYTIIMEIVLYMILTRRIRFLPFLAGAMALLVSVLPSSVLDRALTGTNNVTASANVISAGRTEWIWGPLLGEIMQKPLVILFGNGRFGITYTDVFRLGRILNVSHAHNFYLDTVLDVGITGLALCLAFYVLMLFRANSIRLKTVNPVYFEASAGIMVSILGFLFRGFTDGCMMPNPANVYIWVVFGLCLLLTYTMEREDRLNIGMILAKGDGH